MEIKNLSHLKKAIEAKIPFVIEKHYIRPDYVGQKRVPTKVQSNAFYSVIVEEPNNPVSKANGSLGVFCEFGKASDWTFENGLCKQTFLGKPIWEIRFE